MSLKVHFLRQGWKFTLCGRRNFHLNPNLKHSRLSSAATCLVCWRGLKLRERAQALQASQAEGGSYDTRS